MPLIYKPYQATLANKEGQKLFYPRLVKIGRTVNTQKMAELIAEKASLTAGDVHNVIRNLMSVMREQLLNSRGVHPVCRKHDPRTDCRSGICTRQRRSSRSDCRR